MIPPMSSRVISFRGISRLTKLSVTTKGKVLEVGNAQWTVRTNYRGLSIFAGGSKANVSNLLTCNPKSQPVRWISVSASHRAPPGTRSPLDFTTYTEVPEYSKPVSESVVYAAELPANESVVYAAELPANESVVHAAELPQSTADNSSVISENLGSEISNSSEEVLSTSSATTEKVLSSESSSVDELPEAPAPIPDVVEDVLKEPTFESLGLGGWSPVGIIQNCFEFLHTTLDVPWWTAIMIGTIAVRTIIFPLVITAQRNAAKMNNNLPGLQEIQAKMSDARERGDRLDSARYAQEMMQYMKEKELNPFKNMIVPLAQAPLFISFFMSLRGMAAAPVESMKTGGLWWFTDLTVPDQFYLLPIITSATLALTIHLGVDAARLNATMGMMRYVLKALPIVIFPFIINFPNAILVYWASSNFISLCQVGMLRTTKAREFFKIEKMIVHDNKNLPIKDKGFVQGVSESWTNLKLTKELEERERIDELNFRRAGRGAVKKTFKYDPTKPRLPRTIVMQAKKRDS